MSRTAAPQQDVSTSAPAKEDPSVPSLKRLAITGSMWTTFGFGSQQSLRFISNLILAHLLVPEAFGTVLIVNVVLQGLNMFSDTGIGASIVQDKRGDDREFVNTAWSIQVFRGWALWLGCIALAWPLSVFYEDPILMWLLPIAGITALLRGFNSTGPATFHRHLRLGRLTMFELTGQVASIVATVALALAWRNVWALVIGPVMGAMLQLAMSHTVFRSGRNRFEWDRDSVKRLIRFGRWIFVGTALTFVVTQGDKLILGKVFSKHDLGLYAIAFFLSSAAVMAMRSFANKLLFPLYTRLAHRSQQNLRRNMLRMRSALMAGSLPPLCLLVVFGQTIVELLYPPEFHGVGWMLRVLAAGNIFMAIALTGSSILLAKGDSFRHMVYLISQTALLIAGMVAGAWLAPQLGLSREAGFLIGVAAAPALNYPVLAWAVHRHGAWMPWLDLAGVAASGILIAVGLYAFS